MEAAVSEKVTPKTELQWRLQVGGTRRYLNPKEPPFVKGLGFWFCGFEFLTSRMLGLQGLRFNGFWGPGFGVSAPASAYGVLSGLGCRVWVLRALGSGY